MSQRGGADHFMVNLPVLLCYQGPWPPCPLASQQVIFVLHRRTMLLQILASVADPTTPAGEGRSASVHLF